MPQIGCNHKSDNNGSNTHCQADLLTSEDLVFNVDKFYEVHDKVRQDQVILNLLFVNKPKRHRIKNTKLILK